jgi:DNA-cytosine methyltransferase
MNVLSLFDGMSCGRIALDRLGIKVDNYYASEIDKYAMKVSEANYPDIKQIGDVLEWQLWDIDWSSIDLVTGGFPCQSWSLAGKQLGDKDERGKLFWVMLDVMKKVIENNPNAYYLMENVKMKKQFEEYITFHTEEALPNVNKYLINSALVSAQNRVRYYWTNITGVEQPEQRGMVLRDILETNPNNYTLMSNKFVARNGDRSCMIDKNKEKSHVLSAMEYVKNGRQGNYLACDDVGEPKDLKEFELSEKAIAYMNRGSEKYTGTKTRAEHYIKHESEKSKTLTANMHKGVPYGVIAVDKPVQVGEAIDINGHDILKRVYSEDGKSPTLNACTGGNREPKVMVDKRKPNQINPSKKASGKQPYMQDRVFHVDGKSHALTREFASRTNVGDEQEVYWRKLTPIECERLQTVPDDYTNHVSNTQRYKMLGNGFTVEVICHILNNMEIK